MLRWLKVPRSGVREFTSLRWLSCQTSSSILRRSYPESHRICLFLQGKHWQYKIRNLAQNSHKLAGIAAREPTNQVPTIHVTVPAYFTTLLRCRERFIQNCDQFIATEVETQTVAKFGQLGDRTAHDEFRVAPVCHREIACFRVLRKQGV